MMKLVVFNKTLANAISATASFNTSSFEVTTVEAVSVQAIFTGTTSASAETITIQGSNDNSNFSNLPSSMCNSTTGTFTGTDGSLILTVSSFAFPFMRIAYTRNAAAAGTVTIYATGELIQ